MIDSFQAPRSNKVEVFFTDEERLVALAEKHREILSDEASGVLRLVVTTETAEELLGIIKSHKLAADSSRPMPEMLRLELDEAQIGTLSLARFYSRKKGPGKASDSAIFPN